MMANLAMTDFYFTLTIVVEDTGPVVSVLINSVERIKDLWHRQLER